MHPNKALLSQITRDDRLRLREAYSAGLAETVETYAEAMQEAGGYGDFPAVQAVRLTEPHAWLQEEPDPNGGRFAKLVTVRKTYPVGAVVLVDGFSRCEAAERAGLVAVPAEVRDGTWDDALRSAWTANARHGRQRTRADLHRVLESIVANPLYRTASGSTLARLAGTSCATAKRWKQRRQEQPTATAATVEGVSPPVGAGVPERLRSLFAGLPAARRIAARFKADGEKLARLLAAGDGIDAAVEELVRAAEAVESLLPGVVCGDCVGEGQSCPTCVGRGYLCQPARERERAAGSAAR